MKKLSIDDIESNGKRVCARCGQPIVPANDSGWEVFVEDAGGKATQPICCFCDAEESQELRKAPP